MYFVKGSNFHGITSTKTCAGLTVQTRLISCAVRPICENCETSTRSIIVESYKLALAMVIIALINPLVSFNGIVVQLLFVAHSSLCSSLDSLDFVRRARNILARAHLVIKSLWNLDAEWIDVRRRVVRVPMTPEWCSKHSANTAGVFQWKTHITR